LPNISAKDGAGASVDILAFGTGTSVDPFKTAQTLITSAGVEITPATEAKQDLAQTSLTSITTNQATAAKQDLAQTSLTSITTNQATAAKQDLAKTQLDAIAAALVTQNLFNLRAMAPRIQGVATLTASGDSAAIVVAPPVGQRIAITEVVVQSTGATDVTVLLKLGGQNITMPCPTKGSGRYMVYTPGNELLVTDNTALIANLSVAANVFVFVRYYIMSTSTRLPV